MSDRVQTYNIQHLPFPMDVFNGIAFFTFPQDVRADLQRTAAITAGEQPEPGTPSASSGH